MTDFAPLLLRLEAAPDAAGLSAVGREVLASLAKARAALDPSDAAIAASVLDLARAAMAAIDPSGTTAAPGYQQAWSLLAVARGQVDLLVHAQDPALARAAVQMVLVLDEVILFMPEPAALAPVAFDPAVIAEAVTRIEGLVAGQI